MNRDGFGESCRDELSSLFMELVRARLLHRLADIEPVRVPPSRVPRDESETVPGAPDLWIAGADPVSDQFASVPNVAFVPGPDGFELHHHDGSVRAVLGTLDLLVAGALVKPRGIAETVELLKADALAGSPSAREVRAAMQRLAAAGLLRAVDRQEIELIRIAMREEFADIAKSAELAPRARRRRARALRAHRYETNSGRGCRRRQPSIAVPGVPRRLRQGAPPRRRARASAVRPVLVCDPGISRKGRVGACLTGRQSSSSPVTPGTMRRTFRSLGSSSVS